MPPKPFRFAVQINSAADGKALRELARRAEGLGYSTLYVPDHFGEQWGPIVTMTIAAEATETLNVGALVFDNDYRHPIVLAKEMATLDVATDGRVEFGLGAGWMRTDYEQSGIPYDSPGVRIARMREGLQVMKALWADGKCTFAGEHYTITDAVGGPTPHRRPHPRIVIGGGGRKVLTVAAQEADVVGINASLAAGEVGPDAAQSVVAERIDRLVGWVKEAAGPRFDAIELQLLMFLVQITPDAEELYENLAPAFGLSPEAARQVPLVAAGTLEEVCDVLVERRERWGFSYYVFHDVEACAPLVERLAGT